MSRPIENWRERWNRKIGKMWRTPIAAMNRLYVISGGELELAGQAVLVTEMINGEREWPNADGYCE